MAHNGDTEVDRALDAVVAEINGLTEGQDGGPPVVLTLGGLVIGGTIIPDWQWFDEVEHAARAAFTVHSGGSIDDESGGWARLFRASASPSRGSVTSTALHGTPSGVLPFATDACSPARTAPATST